MADRPPDPHDPSPSPSSRRFFLRDIFREALVSLISILLIEGLIVLLSSLFIARVPPSISHPNGAIIFWFQVIAALLTVSAIVATSFFIFQTRRKSREELSVDVKKQESELYKKIWSDLNEALSTPTSP